MQLQREKLYIAETNIMDRLELFKNVPQFVPISEKGDVNVKARNKGSEERGIHLNSQRWMSW